MQELYFDGGFTSVKLTNHQLYLAQRVGPKLYGRFLVDLNSANICHGCTDNHQLYICMYMQWQIWSSETSQRRPLLDLSLKLNKASKHYGDSIIMGIIVLRADL